jgi:hypothetical protein
MTRFITPRYFTEPQSQAVERSLQRLSIGDEEGVRVFIIALEYELAEYEKIPRSETDTDDTPAPLPAVAPAVAGIAGLADETATAIGKLSADKRAQLLQRLSESDRFARRHDDAYLEAVTTELLRIVDACGTPAVQVVQVPVNVKLNPADEHFIRVVAEAYFECFETPATDNGGEPFYSLLQDIFEISGVQIELDADAMMELLG